MLSDMCSLNPKNSMLHRCLIGVALFFLSAASFAAENILWYDKPATSWMEEALPIGNGRMAAMVFGGVEEEHIQFNEESLWAGGPGEWSGYKGGLRKDAHEALADIRALLKEGRFEEADAFAKQRMTGIWLGGIHLPDDVNYYRGFGAYQPFGDVFVGVEGSGEVTGYRRDLDISTGIASVRYERGGVQHKREFFANYPSNLISTHFTNDAADGTTYRIRLTSLHPAELQVSGSVIRITGALENNGMRFEGHLDIRSDAKTVSIEGDVLVVRSASRLTILISAATSYQKDHSDYYGADPAARIESSRAKWTHETYEALRAEHVADFAALMQRVTFTLDQANETEALPTNQRIARYAEGGADTALETTLFQYGRYLLASSSRPGSMPANLQGKWNNSLMPPWASDYHFNINIQMIYWAAEVTNLSEAHTPLLDYIQYLREPGRQSAKAFFDAPGWTVHTMNNPFGYTSPGWGFPWGFFPAGAAWLCQHMYEHYAYTGDLEFLRNQAFPTMEEVVRFWLAYLIEDESGKLISAPSYSPEHGGISAGASMDHQIVWDLFSNYLQAADDLGVDNELVERVRTARASLLPPQIGRWGQLQEWREDRDDPANKHRHVSHLFALHPGKQISPTLTPKLADAAAVSLNARGDDGTGWSIAWKVNFWARLLDGNRAHKLLNRMLVPVKTTNVGYEDSAGGGVYNNLLAAHPPFQLDASLGATAGIAEMLMQSHAGDIHILPALPAAWPSGSITGLKARGGFEIDLSWKNGVLEQAVVRAGGANSVRLRYGEHVQELRIRNEQPLHLQWSQGRFHVVP